MSLHLLWLISNTTNGPTTSEFLQLFRTSAKFFQSAFFAILYHAFSDALHSLCFADASRIAFRLTIRMKNLRILRSRCQRHQRPPPPPPSFALFAFRPILRDRTKRAILLGGNTHPTVICALCIPTDSPGPNEASHPPWMQHSPTVICALCIPADFPGPNEVGRCIFFIIAPAMMS